MQSSEENVISCNIAIEEQPKMVKILKSLLVEQRNRYIKLLKEFVEIFAWSYEYLKTYDTDIIQHKVPLKPKCETF